MAIKLTEKQRRFVEAYMGEAKGNATQAARLAGYKGNDVTLSAVGKENLGKPLVIAAVAERVASCSLVASREELQQIWTRYARGEASDDDKAILKGSELLAKSQGAFIERRELSGPNGAPLQQVIVLPAKEKK